MEERGERLHRAKRQLAGQGDAVIGRREEGDRLERRREAVDREERPGKEEERCDEKAEDHREADVVLLRRRERRDPRRERQAGEDADRDHEHGERSAVDEAEPDHHHQIGRRDETQADAEPAELTGDDVDDADRRRQHRVIDLVPDDPAHDRVGRLERAGLHTGRGEEPGGEERGVRDAATEHAAAAGGVGDEIPEAEAHRAEEQHRRQEGHEQGPAPVPAIDAGAVLEYGGGAPG